MIITVTLVLLLTLLLLSVPVAAALIVLGLTIGIIFSDFPLYRVMGEISWSASTDFLLLSIPLFVMLGEILLRAGIAAKTYKALNNWLSLAPWWITAGEHWHFSTFCCYLWFLSGYSCDHNYGSSSPGTKVQLLRKTLYWVNSCRWHPGNSHSPIN